MTLFAGKMGGRIVWKGPLVEYVRNWGDRASSLEQVRRQPSALQDAKESIAPGSCVPRVKTNLVCAAILPPSPVPRWSRVPKLRARAGLSSAFGEQWDTCVTRDRRRGGGINVSPDSAPCGLRPGCVRTDSATSPPTAAALTRGLMSVGRARR